MLSSQYRFSVLFKFNFQVKLPESCFFQQTWTYLTNFRHCQNFPKLSINNLNTVSAKLMFSRMHHWIDIMQLINWCLPAMFQLLNNSKYIAVQFKQWQVLVLGSEGNLKFNFFIKCTKLLFLFIKAYYLKLPTKLDSNRNCYYWITFNEFEYIGTYKVLFN